MRSLAAGTPLEAMAPMSQTTGRSASRLVVPTAAGGRAVLARDVRDQRSVT